LDTTRDYPDRDFLLPTRFSPQGDWRQTFYNPNTEESFFCICFKSAIKNKSHLFTVSHPHVKYALENESYLPGICHLCKKTTPHILCGADQKTFSFKRTYGAYIFKTMYQNADEKTFKEAENIVRKMVGYPLVGEGWVSETLLFHYIRDRFVDVEVAQHGRPDFLGDQHYDIWIPDFNIAVEYQGEQHNKPVDYFGGDEAFADQQWRDEKKRIISRENGVTLFYVKDGYKYQDVIKKIEARIAKGP